MLARLTPIPTEKGCAPLVVTVASPDVWVYATPLIVDVVTPILIITLSCAAAADEVTTPVYWTGLLPSDTKPNVPKLQLLFATSACPPLWHVIAWSQQIVNTDTNWA